MKPLNKSIKVQNSVNDKRVGSALMILCHFHKKSDRLRKSANLAVLRKITLNLIRLGPTEKYQKQKLSVNRKRLYASYNPDFLLDILFNL